MASLVAVGSTASTARAKRPTVALSLTLPFGQTSMRIPAVCDPIANQIGRRGLTGHTLGHQALPDVIKILLQRTNERIGGAGALRLIRLRERLHALAKRRAASAPAPCWLAIPSSGCTPCCNAVTFSASLGGVRGVACKAGSRNSFAFPMASSFLSWSTGTKLSIVQVEATSGNAPSLVTSEAVCSGRPAVSRFSAASPSQSEDGSKRRRRLVFQSKRIEIELKPRQGRQTREHDENGDRDNPYPMPLEESVRGRQGRQCQRFRLRRSTENANEDR